MKKAPIVIYVFCVMLITGCNAKLFQNKKEPKITIGHFEQLPKGLRGCSCLIFENEANFTNKHFLFAAEYGEAGYIQINNELVLLPFIKEERHPTSGERLYNYGNSIYNVELRLNYKNDTSFESQWYSGTMTIKKGKTIMSLTVVGECGC